MEENVELDNTAKKKEERYYLEKQVEMFVQIAFLIVLFPIALIFTLAGMVLVGIARLVSYLLDPLVKGLGRLLGRTDHDRSD